MEFDRRRQRMAGFAHEIQLFLATVLVVTFCKEATGLLRPQDSESREVKVLDGMWRFRRESSPSQGFEEGWHKTPLDESCAFGGKGGCSEVISMPVPSSYNDITTSASLRDHVGWVWYDRDFFVPSGWKGKGQEILLRFGSVHYLAVVWVNGRNVGNHSGGHLPFEFGNIGRHLVLGRANLLTVAVNNTLTPHSLPQGQVKTYNGTPGYPPGYSTLEYQFDFFNYAGIHRPVVLYARPGNLNVRDVTVVTDSLSEDHSAATLTYDVEAGGTMANDGSFDCSVSLLNAKGRSVASSQDCHSRLKVLQPHLWWPFTSNGEDYGYLYTFKVTVRVGEKAFDTYRLKIGIRIVAIEASSFLINGRSFYFRGFGRHEDSDIRGKGLDLPLVARDFQLIKWIGANSFRTSHYPYAEEIMDMADSNGIVIIDESPGVALDVFSQQLLENHLRVMRELVDRDKNRASVLVWSLANEPRSQRPAAREYFKILADYTKAIDPAKRPTALVLSQLPGADKSAHAVDLIGVNKYFGWYEDTGHYELIQSRFQHLISEWINLHPGKTFFISEYGADTVAGMHQLPSFIFTEEYQYDVLRENFKAFDKMRTSGQIVGEMIWNFADFMTKQQITRVVGNRKGIFTRERQPKASAHLLKMRYWEMAAREATNSLAHQVNVSVVN